MKCQDIETILIDASGERLPPEKTETVSSHLLKCPECRRLQKDLETMRKALRQAQFPSPPAAIIRETRALCLEEFKKRSLPLLPAYIWAVLLLITVLTGIILVPLVENFSLEPPLNFQTLTVIGLLIQNITMLLFSPLLIQHFRPVRREEERG